MRGLLEALPAVGLQVGHGEVHHPVRAFQVHAQGLVPLGRLRLLTQRPHAVDAGIGESKVQLASARHRRVQRAPDCFQLADLAVPVERLAAALEGGPHLLAFLVLHVG